VGDARRLAIKNGDDPDDWDAVAYWLLQKSKRSITTIRWSGTATPGGWSPSSTWPHPRPLRPLPEFVIADDDEPGDEPGDEEAEDSRVTDPGQRLARSAVARCARAPRIDLCVPGDTPVPPSPVRRHMIHYRTVIFDCDSTLSALEGIEELASDHRREVETLTDAAMRGEVPLDEVYGRRLELIRPTRQAVEASSPATSTPGG
jgi:hypothetical protein